MSAHEVWAADVVLNDGGTVHVRPITPADASSLQQFHARQPAESQYLRYFSPKPTLTDREAMRFADVDLRDRGALVIEDGDEFIAWASYERLSGRDDADVAFQVDVAHQQRGIAALLLEHLSVMARAAGIRRFTAEVLGENRPMLKVFRRTGWPIDRQFDSGVVDLVWPLDDTDVYLANVARREQVADSRSMARFLLPRSVAVIGASERRGSIGRTLIENALTGAADTAVYLVNPRHSALLGQPCYASIEEVPADIGLAVIAVPEAHLAAVVRACARRRVRGAVVITNVTDDFPIDDVVADARRYGMRIVGPGSMGVAMPAAAAGSALHAHLATPNIPPGPLAISLQSGSIGASVLDRAVRLGIGVSSFVSLGDKADVSGNDLLQFWEDDDTTKVIAMYTESFGNPRRFARIAQRVSRTRPIIAVRPGGTALDDALYQQAGVIRVDTVAEMLDAARVLAGQVLAETLDVRVITNSASPARLLASGLAAVGLRSVGQDGEPGWQQLPWSAGLDEYATALDASGANGTVVVIHAPPVAPTNDTFARDLDELCRQRASGDVVAVLLGRDDGPIYPGSIVPNFAFPDDVARVLGRCHRYAQWRLSAADPSTDRVDSVDTSGAEPDDAIVQRIIDETLAHHPDGGRLTWQSAAEMLRIWGVPVAAARQVATCEEAVAAADALGYPVALKASNRAARGRGRDAGVALDLADSTAVVTAWTEFERTANGVEAATVQVMVPSGIECRVHADVHAALGPVVTVGLGGVFAEALEDTITRLNPIDLHTAAEMLAASQAGQVIVDVGGALDAEAAVVAAVSAAMDRHPELAVVDINPLVASAHGCWAVDVEIRVRPNSEVTPPIRRLS